MYKKIEFSCKLEKYRQIQNILDLDLTPTVLGYIKNEIHKNLKTQGNYNGNDSDKGKLNDFLSHSIVNFIFKINQKDFTNSTDCLLKIVYKDIFEKPNFIQTDFSTLIENSIKNKQEKIYKSNNSYFTLKIKGKK